LTPTKHHIHVKSRSTVVTHTHTCNRTSESSERSALRTTHYSAYCFTALLLARVGNSARPSVHKHIYRPNARFPNLYRKMFKNSHQLILHTECTDYHTAGMNGLYKGKFWRNLILARFEVITAVRMAMLLFWVVTSCGLVGKYQRFGETYCLQLQGWRWRQYVGSYHNTVILDTWIASALAPHIATEWLALLFRIREVPGSNRGPETGYPGWGSSWLSSVPPGKCRDSTLN
jgi:hypothetical protein